MNAKILLVDDHLDAAARLTASLKTHGYEVLLARNGMDAFNTAHLFQPDLILLDLTLDGMDGFLVCEILRRQPSTAMTPIILMTVLAGEVARVNGLGSGVDDFVSKPVRPEDLLPRMEALLQSRQSIRADPSDLQRA